MVCMATIIPHTVPISHSVQRRLIATLFAGQSLFSAAQIMTFAVLPIVAVQIAGSDAFAGVPATVSLLGRAAAAYPVGWLMDRYGRRFGLNTGFLLAGIGWLLSALTLGWGSLAAFLLGTFLAGAGRGIGELARYAAADVETEERRAKAIGIVVFAGTVGAIVGPLLLVPAEQLAVRYGSAALAGPFFVGAILAYLALALNALLLRPDPMLVGKAIAAAAGRDDTPAVDAGRPVRMIFRERPVQLALAAMTVGQLVMTTLMVITPLYMTRNDYDAAAISWVFMGHTLGMFGLAGVTGWLVDRAGQTTMIIAGALVLALSAVLTPMAGNVVMLALALFLLGLGWSFCFIAGSALLAGSLQPQERGRVQGASETLVALASGAGSLATGILYTYGGITGAGVVSLLFSLALVAAALWMARLRVRPLAISGD
jgi:MFS family permease